MKFSKIYTFIFLAFFSFQSIGQSVDQSILSQLTSEQIEMAKGIYKSDNTLVLESDNPPVVVESLVKNTKSDDININPGKKYGYEFFSSMPTSLTAVGDLPLPNDYKISLRDQFTIILSGSKDVIFNLNVKLDGTILFPELGSISVAGLSFREVKEKLSSMVQQAYVGVNIDVSLQNLSAKKITIVGAVNTPGTYLVNPFSTITGALAYSGGISEIGSLRNIKLIRNTGEVFSFDLYDLLIKGDRSNDITIEAGDTILINAAKRFVNISGAVHRPAVYEILDNETVNEIVGYALGFTNLANKSNISIDFLDLENTSIVKKTIQTLDQSLNDALSIEVFNYLNDGTSNIRVIGAVGEPGFYDLSKYNSLDNLISDLEFIDVYPWLGVLEQFDSENLIQSTILFSLADKSTYQYIKLLPNSKIHFADINNRSFNVSEMAKNMINDYSLRLNHKQNSYVLPVFGKYDVKSFIDLLGLDMSDVDEQATYINPLESQVILKSYKDMSFVAKKYNTVSFRSPINDLINVTISGSVDYPGNYTLKANSTIKDLYELVGDFKTEAFLDGVIFTRASVRERQLKALEQSESAISKSLLFDLPDSQANLDISVIQALAKSIEPVNLGRIAGDFSPNSATADNTILFNGDSIIIPKKTTVINVIGEVLNPIAFEYSKKMTVQSAIKMAGGFQNSADKKRVYVIKANGVIMKANRNVFMGNIDLKPGDTIVVPRKIMISNPVLKSLAPITEVLSNLAFSAAAIDNLSNNN